ncbi:MAG: Rrf2 family transcriptional regulator [Polyangiaceae bacterium]
MLRITRLSDYAIVVLAAAARGLGQEFTARSAAEETRLPVPAVKKILKCLSRSGIVVSQRGTAGGYRLGRPPVQVALADIIDAVEGPFALTECGQVEAYGEGRRAAGPVKHRRSNTAGIEVAERSEGCEYQDRCAVQANWARVNGIVRRALASVTLADMIGPGERDLVALRVNSGKRAQRVRSLSPTKRERKPSSRTDGLVVESAFDTIEQGKAL